MKKCYKCGGEGPFGKAKQNKDGLTTTCTDCINKKRAVWYSEHRKERNEYRKKWVEKHPDKSKEYAKSNYSKNIEKGRADRRAYYAKNKDKMNARVRRNYHADPEGRLTVIQKWKEANPVLVYSYNYKRRCIAAEAGGTATTEAIQARIAFFGGMCAYCCVRPFEHIDHVIPISEGGSNWPANLRPACASCNLSKNRRCWPLVALVSGGKHGNSDYVKREADLCDYFESVGEYRKLELVLKLSTANTPESSFKHSSTIVKEATDRIEYFS